MDKLMIIGIEGGAASLTVESQFNPKEISVDKSIPWQLQKTTGAGDLEFTSANPKTLSCELMFDAVESRSHIQDQIDALQRLSDIDSGLKRPPKVKVVWGAEGAPGMMPTFEGVIESVGVKYTMFDASGMPLRATVTLRFVEARKITIVKPQ